MIKIAISTSDGKTVDRHFGKADCFYIYKLADNGLEFLEKRDVESYCTPENAQRFAVDNSFNTDRFEKVFNVIKDCKVLYTQQIGDTPSGRLKEKGIEIQTCRCDIRSIAGCSGECSH